MLNNSLINVLLPSTFKQEVRNKIEFLGGPELVSGSKSFRVFSSSSMSTVISETKGESLPTFVAFSSKFTADGCFDFSFSKDQLIWEQCLQLHSKPPTSFKDFKAFAAKPREAKYLARFIFECNEGFVWVLEFEEGSTKGFDD